MIDIVSNEDMPRVVAEWWGSRLLSGNRQLFVAAVSRELSGDLTKLHEWSGYSGGRLILGVDYDPCRLLLGAVREAGIHCAGFFFSADGILPRKTIMRIERADSGWTVWVSEGYGARFERVVWFLRPDSNERL